MNINVFYNGKNRSFEQIVPGIVKYGKSGAVLIQCSVTKEWKHRSKIQFDNLIKKFDSIELLGSSYLSNQGKQIVNQSTSKKPKINIIKLNKLDFINHNVSQNFENDDIEISSEKEIELSDVFSDEDLQEFLEENDEEKYWEEKKLEEYKKYNPDINIRIEDDESRYDEYFYTMKF